MIFFTNDKHINKEEDLNLNLSKRGIGKLPLLHINSVFFNSTYTRTKSLGDIDFGDWLRITTFMPGVDPSAILRLKLRVWRRRTREATKMFLIRCQLGRIFFIILMLDG